jgi:acyl carrier protein
MSDTGTIDKVRAIVAEALALPLERVRDDLNLRALGLNSVRAFELMVMLEDTFDIRIGPEALDELSSATIARLAEFVLANQRVSGNDHPNS